MKKVLLNLQKATELKEKLENSGSFSISSDDEIIEICNTIEEGEEREFDLEEVEKNKEIKSDLLDILYLEIQRANLKKLKNDKKENAYYIKRLSQLKKEKYHLEKVNKEYLKKKETKKLKLSCYITPKDIRKRIQKIDRDMEEIKKKISKFNKETTISIEITPEMSKYISESW